MSYTLCRHGSLLNSSKPVQLEHWLQERQCRSVSVPDLGKLKVEWDRYQHSDTYHSIKEAQMQVDLLNIRMDNELKRPQIRVKMGPSQYVSRRSEVPTGDWNEGFLFVVSYHAQLFNTIEFDLYDKPHKHWPSTRHVGKAKLKLSSLSNKEDIFVTFLPIYEYQLKRTLSAELQELDDASWVEPINHKKIELIGSLQIRVRYKFQYPGHEEDDTIHQHRLVPVPTRRSIVSSSSSSSVDSEDTIPIHDTLQAPVEDQHHPLSTTSSHQTLYGRGDLVQEESYIDNVFKTRLTTLMTANLPDSSSAPSSVTSSHVSKLNWIKRFLVPSKKLPNSSSGRRFGFSQNDSDDLQVFNPDDNHKYHHVIESVNFGDRNFASQWMQDSFEEVAVSHPMVDKLIGLVVSKQTQAMVRAIIKTANSFGQGFRVTGIQLLKAALLIQHFYDDLPRCVNYVPMVEKDWILTGSHYFGFALVAYGWRGLCYLGVYGQTVRGVRDRRSNRLAIIRYLKIDPQDLLGYEYALRKGASFQPSYYVALDRSRRAIVLSIRGTWSLYDAITDLVCEYKPWKNGLVHSGMLASAQWFYTHIIPQIFRYIHHHKDQLESFIITGHSLGGGTASVLTMMVADHIDELRELSSREFELHCYNYAPAAVCSVDLCERYSQYISSFVCKDDIVARLSYGTAMKLKEIVLNMITAYETLGGFRAAMTDPKVRQVCFRIMNQSREKLNTTMYPSLYIPGRIFHIHQEEEKKYAMHETTHEISNEMKLTKTCIEDHMITAYQNAFVSLKDQLFVCK